MPRDALFRFRRRRTSIRRSFRLHPSGGRASACRLFRWIFAGHWHNLRAEAGVEPAPWLFRMPRSFLPRLCARVLARRRRRRAGGRARFQVLAAGRFGKMRKRPRGRIASPTSCRRRAAPISRARRSWSSSARSRATATSAPQQQNYGPHFQAINGRLRSLGLAHIHAGGNPRADRAGGNRRLLQEQSRRRAVGGEAARRELHPARPHLVAGKQEPDDPRSTRST